MSRNAFFVLSQEANVFVNNTIPNTVDTVHDLLSSLKYTPFCDNTWVTPLWALSAPLMFYNILQNFDTTCAFDGPTQNVAFRSSANVVYGIKLWKTI